MTGPAPDFQIASAIDVAHPRCADTPAWRRCAIALTCEGAARDGILSVHVRDAHHADDAHHLFHCLHFNHAIQDVFLDIVAGSFLASTLVRNPDRFWFSRKYIHSSEGMHLRYNLGPGPGHALPRLSAHDRRALQRAAGRHAGRAHAA